MKHLPFIEDAIQAGRVKLGKQDDVSFKRVGGPDDNDGLTAAHYDSHLNYPFQKVVDEKIGLIVKEERPLYVINSPSRLNLYISHYKKSYQAGLERALREVACSHGEVTLDDIDDGLPEHIKLRDCWISTDLSVGNTLFTLEGCRLDGKQTGKSILLMEDCYCPDALGGLMVLQKMESCVLDAEITINTYGSGSQIAVNPVTGEQISLSTPTIIEKCFILNVCEAHTDARVINSYISALLSHTKLALENSVIRLIKCKGMERLNVSECVINRMSINGSHFDEGISISNTTFHHYPAISEITFASNIALFRDLAFLEEAHDGAIGVLRKFKALCEAAHYEHGIILFHGAELEAYYRVHLKKKGWFSPEGPERICSLGHKWVTDYGRDLIKPLAILMQLALIAWGIYFCYEIYHNPPTIRAFADDAWFALKVSFKHALGPLAFALPVEAKAWEITKGIAPAIAFVQVVLSSLIWFMLVFMVRRRFKL